MRTPLLTKSLILFLFIFISACGSDDSNMPEHTPTGEVIKAIDPDFEPFFQSFKDEANKRNLILDYGGLTIHYAPYLRDDAAGWCSRSSKSVYIERPYWESVDNCTKERLIFHELGHCILDRDHKNQVSNNFWVSVMRGAGEGFPNPEVSWLEFKGLSRAYYIDELFDPETPLPQWLETDANYENMIGSKVLIESWQNVDSENVINIDLDKAQYLLEINLTENIEHPPININNGTLDFIESISFLSEDKKIFIDLVFDHLINEMEICDSDIIDIQKDLKTISIAKIDNVLYAFTDDDELKLFTFPFSQSLEISTVLKSGIDSINYYELK